MTKKDQINQLKKEYAENLVHYRRLPRKSSFSGLHYQEIMARIEDKLEKLGVDSDELAFETEINEIISNLNEN